MNADEFYEAIGRSLDGNEDWEMLALVGENQMSYVRFDGFSVEGNEYVTFTRDGKEVARLELYIISEVRGV